MSYSGESFDCVLDMLCAWMMVWKALTTYWVLKPRGRLITISLHKEDQYER